MMSGYCDEHSCLASQIEDLKENMKELQHVVESVRDELKNLSSHEKIYIAAFGLVCTIISTVGAIGGVVITQMWK